MPTIHAQRHEKIRLQRDASFDVCATVSCTISVALSLSLSLSLSLCLYNFVWLCELLCDPFLFNTTTRRLRHKYHGHSPDTTTAAFTLLGTL